jgi:AraC-like DNA-binding protein
MNDSKYILFFLGSLGAFNGLILGAWLLFLSRKKNLPNLFLGCLLLALSIRIGKSVFVWFDPALPKIYLQIGMSGCFLIGPALFYYVRSAIGQVTTLPRQWKWQIAALIGLILLVGVLYPYAAYPRLWNQYFFKIIYTEWFIYIVASAISLRSQLAKLFNKTSRSSLKVIEKWVLSIFLANAVIFLSFFLAPVTHQHNLYFGGSLIFSFVLYTIIFVLLYRRKTDDLFYQAPNKYVNKKVSDDNASALLGKLEQVMVEKEMYKNPNLTVSELAKAVNISGHQLSQLLNDNLGKNFTSYINEYRINEACKMMAANHPFSLEALGYEVGFNAKSTFYTSFKKLKGTTPLLYKEGLTKAGAL